MTSILPEPFVHPTAVVDSGATVGSNTKIWHFCHVMSGAQIGSNCIIGQNAYIGNVTIGDRVKLQNNISVYDGVFLEEEVFVGPSAVFTNVGTPRAHVERKEEYAPTRVGRGATIGANATIVCGSSLGPYCFIGAGAVVTHDVAPHSVVYGTPARPHGWACRCGELLELPTQLDENQRASLDFKPVEAACTRCGEIYRMVKRADDPNPHELTSTAEPPYRLALQHRGTP